MSGIYTLDAKEEAQLSILISDTTSHKDLVEHYKKLAPIYKKWANETINYKVTIDGKIQRLSEIKIIERVKNNIDYFDGGLYRIATHPYLREKIRITHDDICLLFAKNSLARNPVIPRS